MLCWILKGLAYVDFEDDEHLAAAIAKNKLMLLGKKLSIARSNPKQGKKESVSLTAAGGHGKLRDLNYTLSLLSSSLFLPFLSFVSISPYTRTLACAIMTRPQVIAADA